MLFMMNLKCYLKKFKKLEEEFALQNYSNDSVEEDDFADLFDDIKDQNDNSNRVKPVKQRTRI